MSAAAVEQQVNLYQPILGAEKRLFSARAIGLCLALLAVSLAARQGPISWATPVAAKASPQTIAKLSNIRRFIYPA